MSTALYPCYQATPAAASNSVALQHQQVQVQPVHSRNNGQSLASNSAASVPRSLPGSTLPSLAAHPSPAILSISPPARRSSGHQHGPSQGIKAAVAAQTKRETAVSKHVMPHIHSLSTIDTFRKCLSDLDLDDCEPAGENAFLVCDLKRVWDRYTLWQRELGDRVEAFFAVKCNPDSVIIQLMARLGLGFDCASHQEIANVLSFGVDPDKIIYANPCKASSFIRHAANQDVRMMTFDNADELVKVAKFHPNAKMVLRILTDDSGSLCRFGLKFGAPLAEVRGLLEKAKELKVEVIGISFHVGSGCTNPNLFGDAVARARWAFDQAKELGFDFDFLDLGGGFDGDTFVDIAAVLRPAIEQYFPREEGVRVIAEPGRYFVSEAFEMATNIIARRGKGASIDEETGEEAEEAIVMCKVCSRASAFMVLMSL